jgi:hypothetical protein
MQKVYAKLYEMTKFPCEASMLRPYSLVLVAGVTASWACRTRDPDAAGLLDAEPDPAGEGVEAASAPEGGSPQETLAPEGNWRLSCSPADAGKKTYVLTVRGAARPDDESQPLRVSLGLDQGQGSQTLGQNEMGRGAVDPRGPIFVGFESGVLTAEFNAGLESGSHQGVITLSKDKDADALSVVCKVERIKAEPPF